MASANANDHRQRCRANRKSMTRNEPQLSSDSEPVDVVRDPVVTVTETSDDVVAWGMFANTFDPVDYVDEPDVVDEPVVASGTVESGTYTQTIRIATPLSYVDEIEIRRRLILQFDLRDFLLFGELDPEIVTSHLLIDPVGFVPPDLLESPSFATTLAGTAYGMTIGTDPPETAADFDAAIAAADTEADVMAPLGQA